MQKRAKPELNYKDYTDFYDAAKGFLAEMGESIVKKGDGKELKDSVIWDVNRYVALLGKPLRYTPGKEENEEKAKANRDEFEKAIQAQLDSCPATVNKSLWRQALLNHMHGLFCVREGVYQVRGYDLANMTIVEVQTSDALQKEIVIIDCTTDQETADAALKLYSSVRGDYSITAVVFTHSHVDHYGGILAGLTSPGTEIPIIAPEHFLEESALENALAGDAMARRSTYQYGTLLRVETDGQNTDEKNAVCVLSGGKVDAGLGKDIQRGGTVGFAAPGILVIPNPDGQKNEKALSETPVIYEEAEILIGSRRFEFLLCPGTEAPVEMTVWIEDYHTLVAAELATHTLHNLLTPRGAEVRDARLWWKALDRLIGRYGERMSCICATHHWSIVEPEDGKNKRSVTFLEQQRDTYKFLHDQTVRLMNRGYTMLELAAWFDDEKNLPDFMINQWHNRGYYGTVSHDVRAIYQKYLGWYDMNPSNLNPLAPEAAAKRYIAAIGEDHAYYAVNDILNKDVHRNQEDYRWAAELGKHLVFANPSQRNRNILANIYRALGSVSEAGTWRNMYLVGAEELEKGGPISPSGSSTANPAILNAIDDDMLFDYMASRLNAEKIVGKTQINITQDGGNTYYHFVCSPENRVLNFHKGQEAGAHDLKTDRQHLVNLIKGIKDDEKNNDPAIDAFFDLLENDAPNFNIVLPKNTQPKEIVIPDESRRKIMACAMMFETYEYTMEQLMENYSKKLITLSPKDMTTWKNDYYEQLTVDAKLKTPNGTRPYLEDNLFFSPGKKPGYDNLGIGADGIFYKNEYCHFLYECYKALSYDAPGAPGIVRDCINMLEGYVKYFRGYFPTDDRTTVLQPADKERWEKVFRPALVKTNIIVDDKFFDPTGKNPYLGIGLSSKFNLAGLCNVLARCYKLLLVNEIPNLI